MSKLNYREATLDDLPAICELGEAVNVLHHEAWPHVFAAPGDPSRHAGHWRAAIAAQTAATFVCELERRVVGFVSVFLVRDGGPLMNDEPYGRIGSVSIAHDQQGQGVGTALMRCAEEWAQARGAREVRLNVWAFNERALRLYVELGYAVRMHHLGKRLGPLST